MCHNTFVWVSSPAVGIKPGPALFFLKGFYSMKRGYTGIAMFHPKNVHNWGTLCRTASILNVDFIATIGRRFIKQSSDTVKSWRHVPVFEYNTFDEFFEHLPLGCQLIGVELDVSAKPIQTFNHPEKGVYLLGAEDHGIPKKLLERCHRRLLLPGKISLNVSVAGSIVLYDKLLKQDLVI